MRDPMNPEQPPSGPLYAPEAPAGGASGTQRGSGAAPGAQTGSEGFDAPAPVAHATPCGPNVCGVVTHEGAAPEPEPGLQPGLYRHHKGGIYQMIATATDAETGTPVVVYRSDDGTWWTRPAASFAGTVPNGGPRFTPLHPAPAPEPGPGLEGPVADGGWQE